jgi:hypothetical protein
MLYYTEQNVDTQMFTVHDNHVNFPFPKILHLYEAQEKIYNEKCYGEKYNLNFFRSSQSWWSPRNNSKKCKETTGNSCKILFITWVSNRLGPLWLYGITASRAWPPTGSWWSGRTSTPGALSIWYPVRHILSGNKYSYLFPVYNLLIRNKYPSL